MSSVRMLRAGCILFAGLVFAGLVANAQEGKKHGVVDTATVTQINTDARSFTVNQDLEVTKYKVEDATLLRVGTTEIALSDLQVGDRVIVSANRESPDGEGLPIADVVQVVRDVPAEEPKKGQNGD